MRRAVESDAPAIAALHIASWRATYTRELPAAFLDSLDLDERTALWRARLAGPDMRVLLAERDDELFGFCAFGPADSSIASPSARWEILNLHVHPRHHGERIGSRLFDAAASYAREHGGRELVLSVVATNRTARVFYERKGMRPDGRRQSHEVGAGASLAEVGYSMSLE